jgi:hypothetical protein
MQSPRARVAVLIAAVAAAIVLFIVLQGNDDSSDSSDSATVSETTTGGKAGQVAAPLVIKVDKDGSPVGGVQKLTVNKGEDIRFTVESAIADEVHLHGYDVGKDVEAGGSVTFDVPATIEGVFEAEMEGRGDQILDLTVNP